MQAETAARHLDGRACQASLDAARAHAARAHPDQEPPWAAHLDPGRVAGYAGACLLLLGRPRAALAELATALGPPPPPAKFAAAYLADQARALAWQGELDGVLDRVEHALAIAQAHHYGEALRRLALARPALSPLQATPTVQQLDQQLAAIGLRIG